MKQETVHRVKLEQCKEVKSEDSLELEVAKYRIALPRKEQATVAEL